MLNIYYMIVCYNKCNISIYPIDFYIHIIISCHMYLFVLFASTPISLHLALVINIYHTFNLIFMIDYNKCVVYIHSIFLHILINYRYLYTTGASSLISAVTSKELSASCWSVLSASALSASVLSVSALSASVLSASVLSASALSASVLSASVLSVSALSASVLSASVLSASVLSASVLSASALSASVLFASVLSASESFWNNENYT